ncbi:RNA polymerase I-specific transcription-initiation factor-domain-containing protein [Mycena latifolia]|nr:RNA polymerase I-specific transcription-initiation factor-domain-containing protein [Mycena latifolia]
MYSWPANQAPNHISPLRRKGTAKSKEKATYPVLDHGTLAAATLLEENGRLEWTRILKPPKESALLKVGKPGLVFPATRPPPVQLPKMTILQRAEQGANFLRTYVPDIDIAAELIRDEITEDAKILREFGDFDPYVGNQLESIIRSDTSSEKSSFLVFPMGELSRDLNISPFVYSTDGEACLKPSAQAIQTFDTPIQQISTSKCSGQKQASYLSVRTFGATSLLEFETSGSASNPAMRVKELGTVVSSATGGNSIVDVKLAASPLNITLVNSQGAVYKCDMATGSSRSRLIRPAVPSMGSDLFWRLELTGSSDTCLLMSRINLKKLDFRTEDSSLDLYTAISNEILTSVEDYQADQMIRLCTTNQVVWIDRRHTVKPLLAFKHGRAFDRSLEAKTIAMPTGHLTTLSSRKNSLLSIYDISRAHESMPYVQTPPYCLTTSANGIQKGHTFIRHPLDGPESPISFFRLSEVGSIRAFQLSETDLGEVSFSWSEDVERLNTQSAQLREEVSSLGSREPTTVDMFPAYDHIFRAHRNKSETDAEEAATAESLYDLVEKAPTYWQDLKDPVDHVLTTYDVLFRSGDEPRDPTRADFLADSVINSTRGYRALLQGRVSADSLKKDAAWNHDLTRTLSKFDSGMSTDFRTVPDRLRRFDLKSGFERSAQSVRRESEAREQLALDLALSYHVYSPHLLSTDGDANSELETMTKTLSLDGEPPPVSFGILRPIEKNPTDNEELIPMGVRLLLKDWDVSSNPQEYAYRDPYDGTPDEPILIRRRPSPPAGLSKERSDPQQPPRVVAATSIKPFDAGRRFPSQDTNFQHRSGSQPLAAVSGSQPLTMDNRLSGMSQDFLASTQILPGAYGGRPAMKKKMVKKRIGGF